MSEGGILRLVVHDLCVVLRGTDVDIVDEVGLTIGAGEVVGLVGESGSGKTTVALALLGHTRRGLRVASGSVKLEGHEVLDLPPAELRKLRGRHVAYVPQDPSSALNPSLKVGFQLREALAAHAGDLDEMPVVDERMTQVLGEVDLAASPRILGSYPHQLSGGQQQRIGIAMAFSCRPGLIILDEPTTGLDVATQRHVLDTIRGLCRSYGVAAVYVTHDLAVVAEIADRVAVMYGGRIIEVGTTGDVFATPLHPYSHGLLRAIPSPEICHELVGMEGQPPSPGRRPAGCLFAPRCPYVLGACTEARPAMVAPQAGSHSARCIRAAELDLSLDVFSGLAISRVPEPDKTQTALLTVRDLGAKYGDSIILRDVSLDVPETTCVAVVGESGSGKTTLARCVIGLHGHWTGDVRLAGTELKALAKERAKESLRSVQYIFQNPYTSLNPRKTVGQIVEQPLAHYFSLPARERAERVVAALEDAALSGDYIDRYPDQLSGGERQRVAIARALSVQPKLLVCDEVTSALDVSVQAAVVELLRRLQAEHGLSLLFITHNLALVRSIAQHVVVLHEGRVVERGATDDVLSRPSDEYTIRLLEDVPKLTAGTILASCAPTLPS